MPDPKPPRPVGRRVGLATLWLALLWLAGCALASRSETEAFDRMQATEQQFYAFPEIRRELPPLDERARLADFIEYAALNNPGLEAAFHRWKAALMRVPQVRALPDPRFNYGYFVRQVQTRTGPQEHKLSLVQTFPWFGKLSLQGSVALQAAEAERRRFETARRTLCFEVKDAYYEIHFLTRAIRLTRENIELVRFFEKVARTRYKTDAASHADVVKAQVELGMLEDQLRTHIDRLRPAGARLNAVLNRPPLTPVPEPREAPRETAIFEESDLATRLKKNNPELLTLEAVAEKEKQTASLAGKQYYPDISLGVEYIVTGSASVPGVPDSGEDPVVALLSLNLPIWFNKYRAAEHEAELRHVAAVKDRADRENRLLAALNEVLFTFRDAERKIDLYENSLIPKARQSLKVTQQAFVNARIGFLDLIEAERTLLAFRLEFERALADRPRRLAEIEMLVGEDLGRVSLEADAEKEETP